MQTSGAEQADIVRNGATPEPQLIVDKLAKFDQIAADVQASFPFVQDVHGQRHFPSFPIEMTVRYLHALWICDCKDMLLSVPNLGRRKRGSQERFERYEGQHALELLADWQEGQTADVVAFLELKLDYAPFREVTRSIDAAARSGNQALVRRLSHGRNVLLNRTRNLVHALTTIFATSSDRLNVDVREACARYGHTIQQCAEQLAEMKSPLYAHVPHPALARRNMLLMNALGVQVTNNDADRPGRRTVFVQPPKMPKYAYADHVITGEITMVNEGLPQL